MIQHRSNWSLCGCINMNSAWGLRAAAAGFHLSRTATSTMGVASEESLAQTELARDDLFSTLSRFNENEVIPVGVLMLAYPRNPLMVACDYKALGSLAMKLLVLCEFFIERYICPTTTCFSFAVSLLSPWEGPWHIRSH